MIFERIQEALATQFDVDAETITKDTDIMTDLGADSLDLVELIMTLEDEYGVTITDESVYEHKTVGDITAFVESLLNSDEE